MTQQRSIETRARIIETSRKMFSLQGYEATSVSQICTSAGISKGAFYHHFLSKYEVFAAILETWLHELDEDFAALRQSASTVPDGLLAMTGVFDRIMSDSSGSLSLFLEFWRYSARNPEIWKKTNEPYLHYVAFIKNLLDSGVHEGSIPESNTESVSYTMMSLAIGLIVQNMMNPNAQNWTKVSEDSFKLLINGITRSE